jgi:adenosylcobinamide amidohydrolase
MTKRFVIREARDALVISFAAPSRVLSWAVLNGGMCYADHVMNHHVLGNDARFCAQPKQWLKDAAEALGLQGKVVAMATAVSMKKLVQASLSSTAAAVACFATVGCGNALSVGDPTLQAADETQAAPLHTINMVVTVQPGLSDEAMVEAIQIATEGRVRALYDAAIQSSVSSLRATGTGTDCIAVVSLDDARSPYCGKHTQLGDLIGRAAYQAVKTGLAQEATTDGARQANSHEL